MTIYANQNVQSVELGSNNNLNTSVVGETFGPSRGGTKGRIDGAIMWGHDIPIGRGVVHSAIYNQQDEYNTNFLSVSLPDATGEYTVNPLNGQALSHADNAGLLATAKIDSEYVFAGFLVYGDNCMSCECSPCNYVFPECPVGNPDFYRRSLIAKNGSQASVLKRDGYLWVPSAVPLKRGDKLALVDAVGDNACVNLLGAVTSQGNGGIDLPDHIEVSKPSRETPNGGHIVEIFLG